MSDKKITKDTTISEAIQVNPESVDVLEKYFGGHQCFACPVAQMETIGEGAIKHGCDDDKVQKMIDELNGLTEK